MIQIHVDVAALTRSVEDIYVRQIPYAASRALNDTALDAQRRERGGLERRFIIRRPWVLQQIKIPEFSNKSQGEILRARIEVGSNADFLDKFEPGGTKTSRGGRNVAVPIAARPVRSAVVPEALRPKALGLHRQGARTIGAQRTFLLTLRSGRQGIFQRTGPGRDGVRLLYWLTPSVPIPASLRFVATVEQVVQEMFAVNFRLRFDEAKRTATRRPRRTR